jgi:hypothetical protein
MLILPDDDEAAIAAVLARAVAPGGSLRVADSTAQIISALSTEASRIAVQLAALAEQREAPVADQRPIDAAIVRRLLRLSRERARFFPEALFADPAWDMLLDLTASPLEGGQEPVSSLCIATAVPTTTTLRWVRRLSRRDVRLAAAVRRSVRGALNQAAAVGSGAGEQRQHRRQRAIGGLLHRDMADAIKDGHPGVGEVAGEPLR